MASDPNNGTESSPTRSATPPGRDADVDSAALPATVSDPGRSDQAAIPKVPGYEILELIGQGGMGLVYRVRDTELLRDIVLKTPKPTLGDHAEIHQRFLEEATITAQLQHPGVPPVHEIGTLPDGRPYLTMKLVKGETLAARLKGRDDLKERLDASLLASIKRQNPSRVVDLNTMVGDRATAADLGPVVEIVSSTVKQMRGTGVIKLKTIVGHPESFVRYFEQICETIAYAHDRGIIHRDLKPGNVMIGQFGEVQVMDWGLAKKLPRDAKVDGETQAAEPQTTIQSPRGGSGDYTRGALGTWAYASPEQTRGQVRLMDQKSDVFSLGAILCEILTGVPPYSVHPSKTVAEQAQDGDLAAAYSRLGAPGIPAKLVQLAKACLSVERDARPANAQAVYFAVKEYHEELARSVQEAAKTLVKAEEERKRRRTLARSFVAIAASLLIGTGVAIALAIYASDKATKAQKSADAEKKANEATKLAYLKLEKEQKETELARRAAQNSAKLASDRADEIEGNLAATTMQLARARFEENNSHLPEILLEEVPDKYRTSAWKLLKNYVAGSFITLRGHGAPVTSVAFAPDGQTLASGSRDGTVKLWHARTGEEIRMLRVPKGETSVTFSPNGRILASACENLRAGLWDAHSGKLIRILQWPPGSYPSDGRSSYIAVGFSPDGQTLAFGGFLFDVRTGKTIHTKREDRILAGTFSPDGKMFASGCYNKTVKLSDARTGELIRTLNGHKGPVFGITFSPDGLTLASASQDKTIRLWDARTGQMLRVLDTHQFNIESVTFSPDGRTLASGNWDGTLKVWDPRTGQELRTLVGHQSIVTSIAYSPNGQLLASASFDGTVKLWQADEFRTLRGPMPVNSVTFTTDGRALVGSSDIGIFKLWDAATGREVLTAERIHNVTLSRDGRTLAAWSLSRDGARLVSTIKLLNARTGDVIRTFHVPYVSSLTLSPDGQTLASASASKDDKHNWTKVWDAETGRELHSWQETVHATVFSPDGRTLASGWRSTVRLRDTRTGEELRTLRAHQDVATLSYSPDGRTLASGVSDGTIMLWDARTGQKIRTLRGHQNAVRSVTFSPDGQTLASGSADNTSRVWDVKTGHELRTLRGRQGQPVSVSFSPDGQTLAFGDTLWALPSGPDYMTLRGSKGDIVTAIAFSPVGHTLAFGSENNTVRLWDTQTRQHIDTLQGHEGRIESLTFSPNGQMLASGSADSTVKLWDARTAREIHTLRGDRGEVRSLMFSPDGARIYSQAQFGEPLGWETKTGSSVPVSTVTFAASEHRSQAWNHDGTLLARAVGDSVYLIPKEASPAEKRFRAWWTLPDPIEHRHQAEEADKARETFVAACQLGLYLWARKRVHLSPWDTAAAIQVVGEKNPLVATAGWSGLEDGRRAQAAFVDGPTFAGILLKDSGRSPAGLVVRAQVVVDQWPAAWQNREVLGGALYRAGDYLGAVRELNESIRLRSGSRNPVSSRNRVSETRPTIWSCHFLALAHHKLGNADEAVRWRSKAALPKDAEWEDEIIDRYLRREVEAELEPAKD